MMDPTNDYVEIYRGRDGWRWRRKDFANGNIVSESGEAFTEHTYALKSATSLNPDLPIVDTDNH